MNHQETPRRQAQATQPIIPASVPLYIPDLPGEDCKESCKRGQKQMTKVENILVNIEKNIKDILEAVDKVCEEVLYYGNL